MAPKIDKKRIMKLLKSKMLISRLDAIHELKELGDKAEFAISGLMNVVKKDPDDLACINALDVLASFSDISQQIIDIIEKAASSGRIGVQKKAERILAKLDKQAVIIPITSEESSEEEPPEIAEEPQTEEGFFESVNEEQLQQTQAIANNENEVTMDWQLEEIGVGETTDLKTETQIPTTPESVVPEPELDETTLEEEAPQIEDLAPLVEEEKIAEPEVITAVEEEIKPPRNLEEEVELKELGDNPYISSLHNLATLFDALDDLEQDDEKNHIFIHLKVNETLDSLIEYIYCQIGITAEEEWQKFIKYNFNSGDEENLNKIIDLLATKLQEQKFDFCILSYLIFIGSLSQKLGLIDYTIQFYEFILNQDSSNLIVLHNLGMLYGKLGKSDEAIKQFSKIIERDPKNALAYSRIGDLLFYEKKDYEQAKEYYLKVLEIDPKRFSSGINLAAIYGKNENYAEATSILHKCLKDNPQESDLWLNYAILMVKQKKFLEAVEAYSKSLEVAPEDWRFKERAQAEKAKVEGIISSPEYLTEEEEGISESKEKFEIGKLFIFAHDPLDDEVFEAIFDYIKGKQTEFLFTDNVLFGHGSIIDQENFPNDPLSSKNFAEVIWKEQFQEELKLSKFHIKLYDLEEYGKIVTFFEEK
ncbi:MAG: tetratricopeptide repeat protein [Candidatus Heimdallarchaeaceae archaeon]